MPKLTDTCHAWISGGPEHVAADMNATFTVGVKDVIATKTFPTYFGATLSATTRAKLIDVDEAEVVTRLVHSGAAVIGKTATAELATYHPAATTNPWHQGHTPGGSSSGSAAAVAAGHVDVALATQTAGSIGRPAAFCGVLGFKPTFGRYPRSGVLCTSPSLDTVGLMARSTAHLLAADSAIITTPSADRSTKPPRFVRYNTHLWSTLDADNQAAIDNFIEQLENAGYQVTAQPPVSAYEACMAAQKQLHAIEVAEALGWLLDEPEAEVSQAFKNFVAQGSAISKVDRTAAYETLWAQREATDLIASDEVWITPVAKGIAPLREMGTGDPVFCRAWTALGNPTVTLPVGHKEGLPLGVQLVAARANDRFLLSAAARIESLFHKPWEANHAP